MKERLSPPPKSAINETVANRAQINLQATSLPKSTIVSVALHFYVNAFLEVT
jgi:hypothetical protein